MAATEIVSRPDFDARTVRFLTREKAIMDLAECGFSREQAKRLVFLGWLIRHRDLEGVSHNSPAVEYVRL